MCAQRKKTLYPQNNKPVIIMIASMPDKGMKSLGNKSLFKINSKTIIDYQIQHIQKVYKNCDIIIVCGFESKKFLKLINVNKQNISVIEHEMDDFTNFGKSLRIALDNVNNNVIIINANVIIGSDILSKFKYDKSFLLINNNKKFDSPIGCTYNNQKIEYIFYDLENKACELLYLTLDDVRTMKSIVSENTDNQYIFELVNTCISQGAEILPLVVNTDRVVLYDSISKLKKIKKILTNV